VKNQAIIIAVSHECRIDVAQARPSRASLVNHRMREFLKETGLENGKISWTPHPCNPETMTQV